MDVDFSDILEKSRALRSKQEAISTGFGDNIPRLERALPQINRESRRLAAAHSAHPNFQSSFDSRHDDSTALRLLSEYGYETDKIERTLQSVALLDAFEPYQSAPDTDLDAYIAHAHEVAVVTAIETALQHTARTSLETVTASIEAEWQASKRDLVTLSTLQQRTPNKTVANVKSTAPGGAFASPFRFRRSTEKRASTLSPFRSADPNHPHVMSTSHVSPTAPIYEPVVRRAVHSRANPATTVEIATELDDALVAQLAPRGDVFNGPKSVQHLHAVFTALRYISGEATATTSPSEGTFAGMYAAEDRKRATIGAHQYLCLQFREDKMKREIEMRPVEAKRGGVPGMKHDVRSYLNLIFDRGVPDQLLSGPLCDGMPIWPQVYYCLRAGDSQTALDIIREAMTTGCTNPSVLLVEECLTAICSSRGRSMLPHSLLERIVQDYGLSAKRGEDPYQRVCYVVLARLDPAAGDKMALPDIDYSLLFYSIEDYLWLRLSVARLEGDPTPPDSLAMYSLSLKTIQEEVRRFGAAHFDPQGDTPAFYALVLLLTGQFAAAIEYLERGARAITEATHIAFTLYYYGMLRDDSSVKSEDGWDGCYRLDYSELLWRYVSQFARADATASAVYLFTLRDASMRKEFLKKLLLETKAFTLLLGSSGPGSEKRGGVLAELWPLGGRDSAMSGWVSVVEAAASTAEERGDRSSAVALYDVAGASGKVVGILIDRMSAELTSRESPARDRAFNEAKQYQKRIEEARMNQGIRGQDMLLERLLPSFALLLALGEFFDRLWRKEFESAWRLMKELGVLPAEEGQLVSKAQELRVGGGIWADAVCDRVPEVLLGAMEAIAALHGQSGRKSEVSAGLRAAAKTLVSFSGMMQFPSADISARLVGLEVLMR